MLDLLWTTYQDLQPWAKMAVELLALAVLASLAGLVARLLVLRAVRAWRLALPQGWAHVVLHDDVLLRLAQAVPSVVVQLGARGLLQQVPPLVQQGLGNLAAAFTIYHLVRAVTALLTQLNEAHDAHDGPKASQTRSIKSYVQLGKLIAWVVGLLLIVATVLDRSPLLLLSGLGAMSAVLMLVFKDTILSFVAGVQLASNDMLRVGDWIEMPKENADGAVIEINLNTIKVQNWDKTITSIPTWKLMSESFKNWRGMFESGGRRIMRALHLDAATVQQLTERQCARLKDVPALQTFFQGQADGTVPATATNLAAFQAYVRGYLNAHPGIAKGPGMTLMVRLREPTAMGIPLQLYCFTASTVWVEYEALQDEVFDHLIGVLPQFGLALYQRSSDSGSRVSVKTDNRVP